MKTGSKKFRITGNTYAIRYYLGLCACLWNGVFWSTDDDLPRLKERLEKLGLEKNDLRSLKTVLTNPKPSDNIQDRG